MGSLIQSKKRIIMMQKESLLPPEYKQIAYLESNGTQYILTNIQGSSGIECEADVMWISGCPSDACIFGARESASDRMLLIHQYPKNRWTLGYGSSATGLGVAQYGVKYKVHSKAVVGEQFLEVNGQMIYSGTDSSVITNDFNMAMFGTTYNNINNVLLRAYARIYNLSAKVDGVLALNVIPCIRKADNKPGMYDTVSGTFNVNDGEGEFIIPQ